MVSLVAIPQTPFATKTWVETPEGETVPTKPAASGKGDVSGYERQINGFTVTVKTDQPAVVRCSDRFREGTEVFVNGEPASLLRCDLLFAGTVVPAGEHTVQFVHRSSSTGLIVQLALLGLAVILPVVVGRRHRPLTDAAESDNA